MKRIWTGGLVVACALLGCHGSDRDRIEALESAGRGPGPRGEQGAKGEPGPAGSKGEPGAPAAVSGSRLKTRWRKSEDGGRAFVGWQDSELGVPCAFELASDGVERCLPIISPPQYMILGFSDAVCSMPQVFVPIGACAPPTFFHATDDPAACDFENRKPSRFFKVGAKAATLWNASAFHIMQDKTCVATKTTADMTDVYDAEELPPSSFVAGGVSTE